jgi:hypothetical protein
VAVPVLVLCGNAVKPGDVTVMACVLPCPATNPTTRELGTVEALDPELAVVLVFEAPAEVLSGLVVLIPEYSCTAKLTVAADAVCTVTDVTGWALAAYHISPSE